MTLIDSLDSIIMLYSYAGFPERGWKLIRNKKLKGKRRLPLVQNDQEVEATSEVPQEVHSGASSKGSVIDERGGRGSVTTGADVVLCVDNEDDEDQRRKRVLKDNAMSGLSIVLTMISIILAFTYVSSFLMQRQQKLTSECFVVSR
jgi:high-affinity nickel-transport protein